MGSGPECGLALMDEGEHSSPPTSFSSLSFLLPDLFSPFLEQFPSTCVPSLLFVDSVPFFPDIVRLTLFSMTKVIHSLFFCVSIHDLLTLNCINVFPS